MRRGNYFWGIVLLLIGSLLLVDSLGVRLPNGMSFMNLFWPAVLLFAGFWLIAGFFRRRNDEVEQASINLDGAQQAFVKINHGAGELRIHGGAGPDELLRGSFGGGFEHQAQRTGGRLEVRLRPPRDFLKIPFIGPFTGYDWDISTNVDIPISLYLSLGANKTTLDLQEFSITELKLETGASETRLTLPTRGRYHADLDLGAASLEIVIPEGLSARIRTSMGAADFKIDQSRFSRSGNIYQSEDFDSAVNAVDMTIDAGAASIVIK